jgi:hypothetical protein
MYMTIKQIEKLVDEEFSSQLNSPKIKPYTPVSDNAKIGVSHYDGPKGTGFIVTALVTIKGVTFPLSKSHGPENHNKKIPTGIKLAQRTAFKPCTQRQMRLWLLSQGITDEMIRAMLTDIADENGRRAALIEYDYATEYSRSHPLVAQIGSSLGLSESDIDLAFREAATL